MLTTSNCTEDAIAEPCNDQRVRDSRWQAVRDAHIRTHSFCIACGNTRDLEAHHIKPFSHDPSLELDLSNLVTLCTKSIRGKMNCHLIMGHNGCTNDRNASVVHDSVEMLKRINREKYNEICKKAGVLSFLVKNGYHCCDDAVAIRFGEEIISRGLFKVQGCDDVVAAAKRCRLLTLQLFDEKIVLVRLMRNMSHRSDVLEDISFARCIMASNSLGFQALLSNSGARSLDDADHKMIFRMLFDTPGDHGIEHSFL